MEAEVARLYAKMEKLEEQLHAAEERLVLAVHKEIGQPVIANFNLEVCDDCMVVSEVTACPDCGEPFEDEKHSIH